MAQRLGHVSMHRVKWMMRQGMLSTTERTRRLHSATFKLETNPVCTACQYAKQRCKTTPGTVKKSIKEQTQALKTDDMFPGSCISVSISAVGVVGFPSPVTLCVSNGVPSPLSGVPVGLSRPSPVSGGDAGAVVPSPVSTGGESAVGRSKSASISALNGVSHPCVHRTRSI